MCVCVCVCSCIHACLPAYQTTGMRLCSPTCLLVCIVFLYLYTVAMPICIIYAHNIKHCTYLFLIRLIWLFLCRYVCLSRIFWHVFVLAWVLNIQKLGNS